MTNFRTLLGFIVFGLVFSFALASVAKTPDGMTPAVEDVCDGLKGAAYGLCNAYCEAMDCDSDSPKASEKACNKVLENFGKKTDGGIPPCLLTCDDIIEQCFYEFRMCLDDNCAICNEDKESDECIECRERCMGLAIECVGDCPIPPMDPCKDVTCDIDGQQCIDGTCCFAVPGSFCDEVADCNEDNCSGNFGCADSQTCCALVCEEL